MRSTSSLGFKWSDRMDGNAKLDFTTGAFGTGSVFELPGRERATCTGRQHDADHEHPNQTGASARRRSGCRSSRSGCATPSASSQAAGHAEVGHEAAAGTVEDHMLDERWDIEVDAIYYFTSVYDHTLTTTNTATLTLRASTPKATSATSRASVGKCKIDPTTKDCVDRGARPTSSYRRQEPVSLRAGGDYNVMPGMFTVRAGVSYETDGEDRVAQSC